MYIYSVPDFYINVILFTLFHFIINDIDQKSEVGTETGNLAGIRNVEIVVIREGIMIVGAEIVIDIMIVNVDMIGIVTEILIGPAVMIQEAAAGHAHGQGNVPGIMIATGIFSLVLFCKYF